MAFTSAAAAAAAPKAGEAQGDADPPCKACDRTMAKIAEQQQDSALRPYLSCKECGVPKYYNPTADPACEACGRNKAKVLEQERAPRLLPYRECETCHEPAYFKPNKKYVERGEYGNDTVLTSDCFDACWDAALQRVRLFPREAKFTRQDVKENCALHWATYHRAPLQVIKEVAAAWPTEISRKGDGYYEMTPIQIFVAHAPEKESDDMSEIRNTLNTLLELKPKALEVYAGDKLLDMNAYGVAWFKIGGGVEKVLKSNLASPTEHELYDNYFARAWKMLCFVYRFSYYKTLQDGQPDLHALAGCHYQCPDEALQFAIKMKRSEVSQPDENGNLPLHAIATSVPMRSKKKAATTYKANQTRVLVNASPNAARVRNHQGSLPIHLAIKAGKQWEGGIDCILGAFPEAVRMRDAETGLFPFMLAAVHAPEDTVDLVYRLFREWPELDLVGNWREGQDDAGGQKPPSKRARTA